MKERRFVLMRLVSSDIKLTPALVRGLNKLRGDAAERERRNPGVGEPGKETSTVPRADASQPVAQSKRLVFVSPMAGRWIRCAGVILACAAVSMAAIAGASNTSSFESANDIFAKGRYEEAARAYEGILAKQGYSAPVLFNLGNAQLRAGKIGQAILHYERARLLKPNDPDIAANLHLAWRQAGLAIPNSGWVNRTAGRLSLNGWAVVAGVALLTLCLMVPLRHAHSGTRLGMRFGNLAVAVTLGIALVGLVVQWREADHSIVVAQGVAARVAPVTTAEELFKLPEGEAVRVTQTHSDFARVKTQEGQEGWVKRNEVMPLIPREGPRG
jgi:tetratricopeptide (TPR) repeat protein